MVEPFADVTAASRAVLIDVLGVLGIYRSHLVVVGGWVPELRFPGRGHPGSNDVDLAVDTRHLPPGPYGTMCHRLIQADYHRHGATNMFQKSVCVGNAQMLVRVDLIGGEYGVTDDRKQSRCVQEMHVAALRGVDLALHWWDEIRIDGARADAARDSVTARVATVEALICMKALAMGERQNRKDGFDIYFCLRHGHIDEIAANLSQFRYNGLVHEALRSLGRRTSA
jgi:hypothetical protein